MKDKLGFDVTDANTILDGDSVGAFLRSSDGTLLTHSVVGGKSALDVSIADGINVEIDSSHIDDSVRLGDGTSFFTSTSENANIALDVHVSNTSIAATQSGVWNIGTVTTLTGITNDVNIADGGNSITVDALNLDIRDLVFATDKVDVSGSSVTVTATQLDIDDLLAANDSVSAFMKDGAGTSITSTAGALDVNIASGTLSINDAAQANTAILSAADTLLAAGTAEKVVATNLAARKYLIVRNNDNRVMYVGGSGVSAATGFPLSPGSYLEMRAGAAVDVYYDSAKAGHAIRTLELS